MKLVLLLLVSFFSLFTSISITRGVHKNHVSDHPTKVESIFEKITDFLFKRESEPASRRDARIQHDLYHNHHNHDMIGRNHHRRSPTINRHMTKNGRVKVHDDENIEFTSPVSIDIKANGDIIDGADISTTIHDTHSDNDDKMVDTSVESSNFGRMELAPDISIPADNMQSHDLIRSGNSVSFSADIMDEPPASSSSISTYYTRNNGPDVNLLPLQTSTNILDTASSSSASSASSSTNTVVDGSRTESLVSDSKDTLGEKQYLTDKDRAVIHILKLFIADTVTRQFFLKKDGEEVIPFACLAGNSLCLGDKYNVKINGLDETEFMSKKQIESLAVGTRFGIMIRFREDAHFVAAIVAQKDPFKIKVFDPSYPKGLFHGAHLNHKQLISLGVEGQATYRDLYEYPMCSACKTGGACINHEICEPIPCQKSYLKGDSFCQSWSLMYLEDQDMRVPSKTATSLEVATILKNFFFKFITSDGMRRYLKHYWRAAIDAFQTNLPKKYFNKRDHSLSHFINCVKNYPVDKIVYILENEV